MALTFSSTVRNALLDAIESAIGASAVLKIRTGAPPSNVAAASTGTVLATLALPADWMLAAAAGSKAMNGVWQDSSADADGQAAHYEIVSSGGTVHLRGTVTKTGLGGDMTVDNDIFATGQAFTVTSYQWVAPGAGS